MSLLVAVDVVWFAHRMASTYPSCSTAVIPKFGKVTVGRVWFAHRMACTYSTVKLLLYGHSHAYIECRPLTATGAPPVIYTHNCINKLHNISATDAEY